MSQKIPVVLAVDVESDTRAAEPGAGVAAAGFAQTVDFLEALRPQFEDATGAPVRFAWFVRMDPQIAGQGGRADALLAKAPAAAAAIEEEEDAIGLHTHAGRWDQTLARWVVDHGDPHWIDHCLVSSAVAFKQRYGRPCREHRFGDHFSSSAMFDRLASLGVCVDMTPEPGQPSRRRPPGVPHAAGRTPDYRGEARAMHPYGDSGLSILPLSSSDPAPALWPVRRWLRRVRYVGQPRHRTLLIDRAWPSADLFWDLAEEQLNEGAMHLAFAIRSDLILGPRWAGARAVLEALPRRSLAQRLVFAGAEEAVARLSEP